MTMKTLMIIGLSLVGSLAVADGIEKGIEMYQNKNYYGARRFFVEYLDRQPDHAEACYYLGRIDYDEKKYDQAVESFDRAIRSGGNDFRFFLGRGKANLELLMQANLVMKGFYAGKTLNDFEQAVKLNPDDLEARIYLAEYFRNAPAIAGGSNAKAINHFTIAAQKHPQELHPHLALGALYRDDRNYDSAIYYHKNAIGLAPGNSITQYESGKTLALAGIDLPEGEKLLLSALAGDLSDTAKADAYYTLGLSMEKQGRREEARNYYEECLRLDAGHKSCRKALDGL